jgi:AraC family transcriptional regulator of adaptative response/methylated-DNA-[protein]-cysteine methyltransferase
LAGAAGVCSMIALPLMRMTGQLQAHYHLVEAAIRYLEENFPRQPALEELAAAVHLSPFHLQQLFRAWAGIGPARFLQYLTSDFLKARLHESGDLFEASEPVGLSVPARDHQLLTNLEAVTPEAYRQISGALVIRYAIHDTPFGYALIGVTDRGICWLSFLREEDARHEVERMKAFWSKSVWVQDTVHTQVLATQIFQGSGTQRLSVLVKGTNFQVNVWEALLQVPFGAVTTYGQIAAAVHHPRALQAVGSAVGANHLAYVIPCHRVIRKDGRLGDYRWEAARKKCIIGWELAKCESGEDHR